MILWIPILFAALALTAGAPFAAAWAATELTRQLPVPARVGITVLAVAASLWWLAVPSVTWALLGALLSWAAVGMATIGAWGRQRARRPVTPPVWHQVH